MGTGKAWVQPLIQTEHTRMVGTDTAAVAPQPPVPILLSWISLDNGLKGLIIQHPSPEIIGFAPSDVEGDWEFTGN